MEAQEFISEVEGLVIKCGLKTFYVSDAEAVSGAIWVHGILEIESAEDALIFSTEQDYFDYHYEPLAVDNRLSRKLTAMAKMTFGESAIEDLGKLLVSPRSVVFS